MNRRSLTSILEVTAEIEMFEVMFCWNLALYPLSALTIVGSSKRSKPLFLTSFCASVFARIRSLLRTLHRRAWIARNQSKSSHLAPFSGLERDLQLSGIDKK